MVSLRHLKCQQSIESLNYVRDRMAARFALMDDLSIGVSERIDSLENFTLLYDRKWIEIKERHRDEMKRYLQNIS